MCSEEDVLSEPDVLVAEAGLFDMVSMCRPFIIEPGIVKIP
jgi:2,4-dienoyl-CoA reductase-like NADH-dependent reductase (Old Yellow Enzyme family)